MDVLQAGRLVSLFTKLYNTEEEEEGNTFVPPVGLVDQTPFFRGWSKNINYSTKSWNWLTVRELYALWLLSAGCVLTMYIFAMLQQFQSSEHPIDSLS